MERSLKQRITRILRDPSLLASGLQRRLAQAPYTPWKDGDKYPSLLYRLRYQRFIESLGLLSFRLAFWTFLAKRYRPFAPFYEVNRPYVASTTAGPYPKTIYDNGYHIQNEFLPSALHEELSRLLRESIDQCYASTPELNSDGSCSPDSSGRTQFRLVLEMTGDRWAEIHKMINDLMQPYVKPFLGTRREALFRGILEKSTDGSDSQGHFTRWHPDRFVPCIKAIYYPLGGSRAPLSYIEGSHIIDKEWIRRIRYFMKLENWAVKNGRTYLRDQYPISKDEERRVRELNNLPPNTLYIGAHHGLHRKKPFDQAGERITLSIEYYNTFTKFDLLAGGLRHWLRMN